MPSYRAGVLTTRRPTAKRDAEPSCQGRTCSSGSSRFFLTAAWWLAAMTLGSLLLGGRVYGVEWYVDNVKGDDTRDGRSAEVRSGSGPFRTIARALRAAEAGDRIILANTGQPYRESITLQGGRHSGTDRSPFALVGNGAVLEGRRPVPPEAWEHVGGHVFRFRPRYMAHQVLYLDDDVAARVEASREREELPTLEPLQWCLWRGHIYFCTEEGKLPSHYRLSCGGQTVGITLYEVRHVIIMELTVRGYQLDGINAHDGAHDVILANVAAEGNGRSGFSVGGASRVFLWQCQGKNNGEAQMRAEGYAHVTMKECHFESGPGEETRREDHAVIEPRP